MAWNIFQVCPLCRYAVIGTMSIRTRDAVKGQWSTRLTNSHYAYATSKTIGHIANPSIPLTARAGLSLVSVTVMEVTVLWAGLNERRSRLVSRDVDGDGSRRNTPPAIQRGHGVADENGVRENGRSLLAIVRRRASPNEKYRRNTPTRGVKLLTAC